ncbi:MAG: ImmA/IrrE family metallo-endopeptidase [Actinobacteria bacterium]|nr:ImmA/IrrE family metallo-endopeptidase [Actinomycetota bacterium]
MNVRRVTYGHTMTTPRYNPWTHLATHWPHIHVDTRATLPHGMYGAWTPGVLHLSRRLTQTGRRCTLAHEIVHLERGPTPTEPMAAAREELTVDRIAARRLITIDTLADAIAWTRHPDEIADYCWVDRPTLRARIRALQPDEWSFIERAIDRREDAA